MYSRPRIAFSLSALSLSLLLCPSVGFAQQTLGGITGVVTDGAGAILPGTTVVVTSIQTGLTRTQTSGSNGYYAFSNLPIGDYTLTFTHDGFKVSKIPTIAVQADRTGTVNADLVAGGASDSVTVDAVPLMNATDTTNGYVLEKDQIESIPLPTGSFTGLAIASPGVNAELPGGTGVNSGLGNAPIWANGQRDTSNSFLLNGVDGSNLFNGKSTSQVASARVVNNTGVSNSGGGGVEGGSSSVYLAIGNAIPTPAPETIEEVRVNASMYDASQGSSSGAHIDLSTKSGANTVHGSAYGRRGTNWINAAPFFFKKDTGIPESDKNPSLHRYTAGGTLSGPLIKDKLFGFVAYQHLHISDEETGDTTLSVPKGLSNDRSAITLASLENPNDGTGSTSSDWSSNPVGLALFQAKMPNGQYLIPNDNGRTLDYFSAANAFEKGTSYFISDQAVAGLDWNASSKDLLAIKYYYQHDPSTSPYALSSVPGFTEHMDTGSQVFSINNVQNLRSNLNVTETLGFIREKAYSTNEQPFAPGQAGTAAAAFTTAFGSYFPGITIVDVLNGGQPDGLGAQSLNIGPSAASQSAYTGIFQNRIQPSLSAIYTKGRHTLQTGGSYSYTQLNVRDQRTGKGTVATPDFTTYGKGWVTPYSTNGFVATTFLQGDANRYYRANQLGLYAQDKYQVLSNVSLTVGARYDWNGGLTEKYGRIYNFDPTQYAYNAPSDVISNAGLIIAGNNVNGTSGVSKTTLTGRQWGFAPRLGAAWQPGFLDHKLVVRGGMGMYYDRGELYTYLSPGYAAGEVSGGPFGISQTPPFVTQQSCPYSASYYAGKPYPNQSYLYDYYIPICGDDPVNGVLSTNGSTYSLASPWGTVRAAGPSNPKASDLVKYLPTAAGIIAGVQPFTLGDYARGNKLPYSINFTLDLQYQPRRDVMVEIGYVGNLGRHQVIPLPFNQAQVATQGAPTHPGGYAATQQFSYGYTVLDPNTYEPICVNDPTEANCKFGQMQSNYEGGNVDLRVPYLGYSSESESYTAAGISAYHALQVHVDKRISHGFLAGASYTYSHVTDEQSALGLFYNGNDPKNLRSGYGSADFDRTHVLNVTYSYTLPKFYGDGTLKGKLANSWSLNGIVIVQSGQPYSVIDYSGAVGSLYYSTFDGITNPIVPLAPGCTPKSAKTGDNGAFYNPITQTGAALKASCFTIPLIAQGTQGVPVGDAFETGFTAGQRNIFRQTWQKRGDMSLVKTMQVYDKYSLKYTFDVFNVTNTTSFDIPTDNVSQNAGYNNEPFYSTDPYSLYTPSPAGLGVTKHAIGSPRQIQMSLRLLF
ncbi:Carboxypeptidase regulatory-like domain-containing protein [Granulicella rosea]|uniref:Carboxypeptidase regulatory-like domain-containing protein n=1 Tax=Granulicella rosea TaxID=474952 RepID=A0A239CX91_9BACT|nr:TonB-dependent receptor [Granulicella rosea]SNS24677.1 Carboxypeptidase regulatory-like domain-containing protein [Granulicella rosea]